MNRIVKTTLALAAFGLMLALCEMILPQSGAKKTAKAAMGLLLVEWVVSEITGILR